MVLVGLTLLTMHAQCRHVFCHEICIDPIKLHAKRGFKMLCGFDVSVPWPLYWVRYSTIHLLCPELISIKVAYPHKLANFRVEQLLESWYEAAIE